MCREIYGKKKLHEKTGLNHMFTENGNIYEENLILIFRCEPSDTAKATNKFSEDLSNLLINTWEREKQV